MKKIEEALNNLSERKYRKYGQSLPLPNERDHDIINFLKEFSNLQEQDRDDCREKFTIDHSSIFFAFAGRMASLSVRNKDPEIVFWGLLALMVEGFKDDPRENVLRQALLYSSCRILDLNFEEICERAIPYGPEVAEAAVHKYIERPEEQKGAEAMDYIIDLDAPDFIYKRNWDWG